MNEQIKNEAIFLIPLLAVVAIAIISYFYVWVLS